MTSHKRNNNKLQCLYRNNIYEEILYSAKYIFFLYKCYTCLMETPHVQYVSGIQTHVDVCCHYKNKMVSRSVFYITLKHFKLQPSCTVLWSNVGNYESSSHVNNHLQENWKTFCPCFSSHHPILWHQRVECVMPLLHILNETPKVYSQVFSQ